MRRGPLTAEEIEKMRDLYVNTNISYNTIAARFSYSGGSAIYLIAKRYGWKRRTELKWNNNTAGSAGATYRSKKNIESRRAAAVPILEIETSTIPRTLETRLAALHAKMDEVLAETAAIATIQPSQP